VVYCFFVRVDLCVMFVFFFSSRRRHTRSKRDWSSDVCSSDLTLITITFFLSACSSMSNAQQNQLTKEEKQEGWKLLFDGNSIDHWRGYQKERVPTAWKVKDGNLTLIHGKDGGDLISRKKYEDCVLKLDWKVEKGGNSVVFYKAMEQPTQAIYWSAPEIQVLDNKNHPDANKGENGNRKSGSLYDLIPAKPQNANPYGEWNSLKLVVKGPHIQHWQNGEMVVEYKMWDNE